jgi:hypothetical protein
MKPRKIWGWGLLLFLFLFLFPVCAVINLFGKEWAILFALSLASLEFYLSKAEKDE